MGNKQSKPRPTWEMGCAPLPLELNNIVGIVKIITNGNRYLIITYKGIHEYNMYKDEWELLIKYNESINFKLKILTPCLDTINNILYVITTTTKRKQPSINTLYKFDLNNSTLNSHLVTKLLIQAND